MKRFLKLSLVVVVVGLLALATTAPVYAIGPGGNVPGDLSSVPGHAPSCEAQNPDNRPNQTGLTPPAEDLKAFYDEFCG